MANYLVLITTLGSVRGVHARLFEAGETVDLDDPDLAAVGVADGWLKPVAGAAAPAAGLLSYRVLEPKGLPEARHGWASDLPQVGAIIQLAPDAAAPLIDGLVVELVAKSGKAKAKK